MDPKKIQAIMQAVEALESMLDEVDSSHLKGGPVDGGEDAPAAAGKDAPEGEADQDAPSDMADDPDSLFGDQKPQGLASILGDDEDEGDNAEEEEDNAPPMKRR